MFDCGDSIRVVHPLFQAGGDGSTPISPLHLQVGSISLDLAIELNALWHSRLPRVDKSNVVRTSHLACFGAECANRWYAAAIWTNPISPSFARKPYLELRRFAIAPDAPKNTASRMIAVMTRLLKKSHPRIVKLISYQDCDVHTGAIYAASGWQARGRSKGGAHTWERPNIGRHRSEDQATGDKVRWERDLFTTPSDKEGGL